MLESNLKQLRRKKKKFKLKDLNREQTIAGEQTIDKQTINLLLC